MTALGGLAERGAQALDKHRHNCNRKDGPSSHAHLRRQGIIEAIRELAELGISFL